MAIRFSNNARSTLASGITASATSITVADGSVFPALAPGDHTYVTLEDVSGNLEVVKVTAISSNTLTVIRGQDGTTARAYSSGDFVQLRVTAALLNDLADEASVTLWADVQNKPDPVITLAGDATGSATLTDLGDATLTVTIADDSHNHTVANVDGLQAALDAKQNASTALTTSTTFGGDVSGTYNAIVIADDSHNHVISNVDGLQAALDSKLTSSSALSASNITSGTLANARLEANVFVNDGGTYSVGFAGDVNDVTGFQVLRVTGFTGTDHRAFANHHNMLNIPNTSSVSYVAQIGFETGGTGLRWRSSSNGTFTSWYDVWHSGNDGASSGLDADLLDGQHGSYYAPASSLSGYVAKAGDTMTGNLTVPQLYVTEDGHTLTINPHALGIDLHSTGNIAPHYQTSFALYTGAIGSGSQKLYLNSSGDLTVTGSMTASGGNSNQWNSAYTYSQVGHLPISGGTLTGNIGAASGHIAGKFAVKSTSVHASYDLYNNGTTYLNGAVIVDDALNVTGANASLVVDNNIASPSNYYNGLQVEVRATSGTAGISLHRSGYSHVGIYTNSFNRLDFDFNSGDVIMNHNAGTLWGSGNDGSGSGLDADLLDGQHGSYYAPASSLSGYVAKTGDTMTGTLTFTNKSDRIAFGSTGTDPGWGAPYIWREGLQIAISDYSGVALGGYDGTDYGARLTVSGPGDVNIVQGVLKMGGTTIVDSNRRFYVGGGSIQHSSRISFLNGSNGNTGSGAQGIAVESLYAGTSYTNTAPSGMVNALNGYQVGNTTVIDSSRNISAVRFRSANGTTQPISASYTFSNVFTAEDSSTRVAYFDGKGGNASVWWGNGANAHAALDSSDGNLNIWVNPANGSWYRIADFNTSGLNVNTGNLTVAGNLGWNAGNDGSGSGLDADLLDGQHGSYYASASSLASYLPLSGGTMSGTLRFNQGAGFGRVSYVDNYHGLILRGHPNNAAADVTTTDVTSLVEYGGDFRFYKTNGTVNELLFQVNPTAPYYKGNTIWHSGNDGSGSGLDADLLDGMHRYDHRGVGKLQTIEINGDEDKYYPVVISGASEISSEFQIYRGYNELAPASWNLSTHQGGLTFRYRITGAAGWGGYPTKIHVYEAEEIYTTVLGGIAFTAHTMKHVVWLRGGGVTGARYHFFSPSNFTLEIFDDTASGYTAGSGWLSYGHTNTQYNTYVDLRTLAQRNAAMEGEVYGNMSVSYATGQSPSLLSGTGPAKTFWHSSNDGSGSGLDADTVDGIDSSQFLRSDASDTATGSIVFNGASQYFRKSQTAGNYTTAALFTESYDSTSTGIAFHISGIVGKYLEMNTGGNLLWNTAPIWHSANDGSGSGLDADLLDGIDSGSFVRSDANDTLSAQYTFTKTNDHAIRVGTVRGTAVGSQSGEYIHMYERVHIGGPSGWGASVSAAPAYGLSTYGGANLATATGSVTIGGNTAWHAGNDGAGSGLDADLLDGYSPGNTVNTIAYWSSTGNLWVNNPESYVGEVRIGAAWNRGGIYASNAMSVSTGGSYIDHVHSNTTTLRHLADNSSSRLIIGQNKTATTYTLIDGAERPGVYVDGGYPFLTLNSNLGNANTNHGPTIQFSHNGNSNRQWVIGSCASGDKFDLGYSDSGLGNTTHNPHHGIAGYVGTTWMTARPTGRIGFGWEGDWGVYGANSEPLYPFHFIGSHQNGHTYLFRNNGGSNGAGAIFVNTTGNHSWGIVSEFRIDGTGSDRPSILFSHGFSSTTWSVGFGYADDHFRINQNHGHRNGGWGTTRFLINDAGNPYFNGSAAWYAGNDGSGSGLDADVLDGLDSSAYLRDDGWNTYPGQDANTQTTMRSDFSYGNNCPYTGELLRFGASGYSLQMSSAYSGSGLLAFRTRNGDNGNWNSWATVWNTINDGSGSGLDADLLDGVQGTDYFRCDGTYPNTDMNTTVEGYWHVASTASNLPIGYYGHRWDWDHVNNGQWVFQMYAPTSGSADLWIRQKRDFVAQTWQKVWTSVNDGAGSGLDADLLDGLQGSSFWRSDTSQYSTSNTEHYFQVNRGGYCGSLSSGGVQAYSASNNSAFMSFHKGGHYAVNMGLDADNVLRIGGWSASANRWVLDMSGNMTAAGNVTAYSDIRLKENIKVIPDALEKVQKIRGVTFTRNDQEDKEKLHTGVIAQEVEAVLPEVISEDNLGIKNVAYGNMVGLLIEAIKELKAEVDDLKAQLKEK